MLKFIRFSLFLIVLLLTLLLTVPDTVKAQCNGDATLPGTDLTGCNTLTGNLLVGVGFLTSTVTNLITVVGDITFTGLSLVSLNAFTNLKNVTGSITFSTYLCLLSPCDISLPKLEFLNGGITFTNIGGLFGANIGPFPFLKQINGDLNFNPAAAGIRQITGFNAVKTITGSLKFTSDFSSTTISNFMNSLSSVQSIQFSSYSPPTFSSSFANLTQVINNVVFSSISSLVSLPSIFSTLTTIGGSLQLSSLSSLDSLLSSTFPMLTSIGGSLQLSGLTALKSISFPALSSIGDSLQISGLGALTSIAFPTLSSVGGSLTISSLNKLTSIIGLNTLKSVTSLILTDLPLLQTFPTLSALEYVLGFIQLKNLPAISSSSSVLSLPALRQVGALELASLSFSELAFPNLTVVANYSALSLSSLISGTYSIHIAQNNNLLSLKGFRSLVSIGLGKVYIDNNKYLCDSWPVNITAILNTTAIYKFDSASPQPACICSFPSPVSDLFDFTNCKSVSGNVSINYPLSYLEGSYAPSFLQSITGSLILENSVSQLPLLDSFLGLTTIGGNLLLRNNTKILSTTLKALTSIAGSIIIDNNPLLQNLNFLSSVVSINSGNGQDSLVIKDSPSLVSLAPLANVVSIGSGKVTILNNVAICGLSLPVSFPTPATTAYDNCTTRASINVLDSLTVTTESANTYTLALKSLSEDVRTSHFTGDVSISEATHSLVASFKSLVAFAIANNNFPSNIDGHDLGIVCDNFVNPFVFNTLTTALADNSVSPSALLKYIEQVYDVLGRRDAINSGCVGYTFSYTLSYSTVKTFQAPASDLGHNFTSSAGKFTFSFPQSASTQVATNDPSTPCGGLLFITYENSILPAPTNATLGNKISSIVSFSARNSDIKNLVDPVVFSIKVSDQLVTNPICGFWNYTFDQWDTQGCSLVNSSSDGVVTCQCNHLTNFAVLFGIDAKENLLGETAIQAVSYLGCALSILGCVLTIITFALFRQLRVGPVFLVINLCLSLVGSNILLIVSGSVTSNPHTCKAVAVLLHYFLLTGFAWMLSLGIFLYFNVVKLQQQLAHQHKWYFFGSWLTPALVIIVIMIINSSSSDDVVVYAGENTCWITNTSGIIGAFVVPVGIIVFLNSVIFSLVIYNIRQIRGNKMLEHQAKGNTFARELKIYITMLLLLGVSWTFAYLALMLNDPFFMIFFIVTCGFQGFFIFLAYCVNDKVFTAFKSMEMSSFRLRSASKSSSPPSSPHDSTSSGGRKRSMSVKSMDVVIPMYDNFGSVVSLDSAQDGSRRSSLFSGSSLLPSRTNSFASVKKNKSNPDVHFENVWVGDFGSALSTHL